MTVLFPLDDRLLVRVLDPEEQIGGVIIPAVAQDRSQRAEVVAVGPGSRHPQTGDRQTIDLEPGDVVVFSRFGGVEVRVDLDDLLLLREGDVLAKEV